MPADGEPEAWQRIDVLPDPARVQDDRVDIVQPVQSIEPVALPAVEVSDVALGDQDIRFTVDQVGVPVLVKVSYFPNWKADGAEGPWRIAPNLMVVVPTDTDVRLTFERAPLDWVAYLLTLAGIGLLFVWRRQGDVVHIGPMPVGARVGSNGHDGGAPADELDHVETVAVERVDPHGDHDGAAGSSEPEPSWGAPGPTVRAVPTDRPIELDGHDSRNGADRL
jgi:hypothetical protein